jgi:hypothetical protein
MSVRDVVQAAAGVGGGDNLYVEDVFSTYLYTGNGSTQTITNGIDLDGEGGMVWTKGRSTARNNNIVDSVRGVDKMLYTNTTDAEFSLSGIGYSSYVFGSTGFTSSGAPVDSENNYTFASWTLRKSPKFFDVVTWTGDGTGARTISHNLGATVGSLIIKKYSTAGQDWFVYHRSAGGADYIGQLNEPNAFSNPPYSIDVFNNTAPTNSVFSVGSTTNQSSETYVAYVFAHDAGGFGLSGEDNVISCGSVSGFGTVVNLGFEPQWILMKQSNGTSDWIIADNMRGIATGGNDALLFANTSGAETSANDWIDLTSTGFVNNVGSGTFIYIAIRRPMKTPESGTEVFNTALINGEANPYLATSGFPVDLCFYGSRQFSNNEKIINLRSAGGYVSNNTTTPFNETTNTFGHFDSNTGMRGGTNSQNYAYFQMFKRAPYFYEDTVFVGNGVTTGRSIPHNLKVTPELILFVWSSSAANSNGKYVYHKDLGATRPIGFNNNQAPFAPRTDFFDAPTDTNVVVKGIANQSGYIVVASCFATLAGISKVGSYSGNGSSQNIDCGFSAGARFIIIKRTDSGSNQGDNNSHWYFYDSARGIVSGNDPYSVFNNVYPENAYDANQSQDSNPTDSIDPYASGFAVNQETKLDLNKSGGSYIFLAIA